MSASASSLPVKARALLALKALPPLSPVLHRVIASLAHEDVSFAKVAELIEKDMALAGNILQLVNSPLYSIRGTVSSVRHAVSILGVNKLRNAVLGLSAAQMWRSLRTPPGWLMADFNRHSVSVAILADLLSQHLPVRDSVGAFVQDSSTISGCCWSRLACPRSTSKSLFYARRSRKVRRRTSFKFWEQRMPSFPRRP